MNAVRRKLSELTPIQKDQLYRQVFDSPDGQLLIEDIKESGYVYQSTAAPQPDPNLQINMNIREGMKTLALLIESKATKPYQPQETSETI